MSITPEKSYIEASLDFIESGQMRKYLYKRFAENGFHRPGHICAEIVSYAPAPIERKIPVLDLIAAQVVSDPESDLGKPEKLAREHRAALDERYNTPSGTIFWLKDWYYHDEGVDFDDAFFTEFDAAVRFIKELPKDEYSDDYVDWLTYSIDKYIPGADGKMVDCCGWLLNACGDIWYFSYNDCEPEDWEDICDWGGMSLNLPVPFQPGDIILADCRPFSKVRRVLILETGDNCDCCCVQCLYAITNGKVSSGAFKHNTFLSTGERSHISGLYRAERWEEELPEEESLFADLSAAIKAKPELGVAVGDWVHSHMTHSRNDKADHPGVYVAELLDAFELRK